jgi:hypothetical protein
MTRRAFPENRGQLSIRRAILVYLMLAGTGNLLWEAAQLPLYTIWWTGAKREPSSPSSTAPAAIC